MYRDEIDTVKGALNRRSICCIKNHMTWLTSCFSIKVLLIDVTCITDTSVSFLQLPTNRQSGLGGRPITGRLVVRFQLSSRSECV